MVKSIIMFVIFFMIDVILFVVLSAVKQAYAYVFLPAIFLEIAFYGSYIMYNVAELNKKQKAMIKPIIVFAIFFTIDVILIIALSTIKAAYVYGFLPAIFLETAFYGSYIMYSIVGLKEKKEGEENNV